MLWTTTNLQSADTSRDISRHLIAINQKADCKLVILLISIPRKTGSDVYCQKAIP